MFGRSECDRERAPGAGGPSSRRVERGSGSTRSWAAVKVRARANERKGVSATGAAPVDRLSSSPTDGAHRASGRRRGAHKDTARGSGACGRGLSGRDVCTGDRMRCARPHHLALHDRRAGQHVARRPGAGASKGDVLGQELAVERDLDTVALRVLNLCEPVRAGSACRRRAAGNREGWSDTHSRPTPGSRLRS